jgi:hypothetical protein
MRTPAVASAAAIALIVALGAAPTWTPPAPPLSAHRQPAPVPAQPDQVPAVTAPAPVPVPTAAERRAAAAAALELLSAHLVAGQLDYHFNTSGEGVCLGTAGLAFIGSGSTLARGAYKPALTRILERMRQIMEANDFPLQPTWGCAQTCIFLAELHRTAPPDLRPPVAALLAKYVDKLVRSQTTRGSWCHTFEDVKNSLDYDDLMAVSVMAMQGLGMARREGVAVAPLVIDQGLRYIEASSDVGSGHIGYSPRSGQHGMGGAGRAGGGLLALAACGQARSPLARAAATYLTQSFASAELNAGHASAQLSESWAAWWAGENGAYDAFWAGQGAAIMARRKPDGGFHCAPSDGKAGDPPAERGDFANAMHALMLVAPEGFLFAGEAKDSPQAAIEDAITISETWGASAPESLRAFAALKTRSKPAGVDEVLKQLTATIKALAKAGDERSAAAIFTLLGGAPACQAAFDAKARLIRLELTAPAWRVAGLAKGKLQVAPDAGLMTATPMGRAVAPTTAPLRVTLAIGTRLGQTPAAPLAVEVVWDLAGLAFTQKLPVTVGTP